VYAQKNEDLSFVLRLLRFEYQSKIAGSEEIGCECNFTKNRSKKVTTSSKRRNFDDLMNT